MPLLSQAISEHSSNGLGSSHSRALVAIQVSSWLLQLMMMIMMMNWSCWLMICTVLSETDRWRVWQFQCGHVTDESAMSTIHTGRSATRHQRCTLPVATSHHQSTHKVHYYQPWMWPGNALSHICLSVCLTCLGSNFWMPWPRNCLFAPQVHVQNIQVAFMNQGHRVKVKVKVTGAKVCMSCSGCNFWTPCRSNFIFCMYIFVTCRSRLSWPEVKVISA